MSHDDERLEETLAATWNRSRATRLALDLASPARRAVAVAEAGTERGAVPQRDAKLMAKLREERSALPITPRERDLGLEL